jgi:thioredoxin 1
MQKTKSTKSFNEIVRSEPLVLVDFFTEWCGPCKMMKPILEQVHTALGDQVKILKVDVDKNPNAGQAFQIRGVPTLILFKKGEIVWRQSGVVPAAALQQLIKTHQSN